MEEIVDDAEADIGVFRHPRPGDDVEAQEHPDQHENSNVLAAITPGSQRGCFHCSLSDIMEAKRELGSMSRMMSHQSWAPWPYILKKVALSSCASLAR